MNFKSIPKKILLVGVIVISIICFTVVLLFQSKYCLTSSNYILNSEKITAGIRIIQLTDLHNSEFGEDNQRLIDMVEKQSPDLILITGDQLNQDEADTSVAVHAVAALCEVAPVYFSLGNHEIDYQDNYQVDVKALFESAGATVLDWEYVDLTINGQDIRLGGIYGYCVPARFLETKEADLDECRFLYKFQDTESYTILMCHMPYCWLMSNGINEWDIDCVFSGHTHGGQIIFPLIGGLYGPDFGWFPGKLEGLYFSDERDKVLVLSRGLGSSGTIPRFNNVPEIMVVDLLPLDSN